ncbi:hypothetical protein AgCh_005152 [Apium graveolens]
MSGGHDQGRGISSRRVGTTSHRISSDTGRRITSDTGKRISSDELLDLDEEISRQLFLKDNPGMNFESLMEEEARLKSEKVNSKSEASVGKKKLPTAKGIVIKERTNPVYVPSVDEEISVEDADLTLTSRKISKTTSDMAQVVQSQDIVSSDITMKQATSDIAQVDLISEDKSKETSDIAHVKSSKLLLPEFTKAKQTQPLKTTTSGFEARVVTGKEARDKSGLGSADERRVQNTTNDPTSLSESGVGATPERLNKLESVQMVYNIYLKEHILLYFMIDESAAIYLKTQIQRQKRLYSVKSNNTYLPKYRDHKGDIVDMKPNTAQIRTYLGIKGLEFNLESDKAYVIRLDQELRKVKIIDLRYAIFQTGEDTAELKDVKRGMIDELRYAERCFRMDSLYSKLYATYNELKANKFTEMEKLNRNQEEKFLAFTNGIEFVNYDEMASGVNFVVLKGYILLVGYRMKFEAADELLQQYRIENDRLVAENEDLRSELALTRSSMDDKIAEYQKLLMEENQKRTVNELSSHCVQEENKLNREKTDTVCISTISKLNKRMRFKEKEIAIGTLQPRKAKTYKDGFTCFFCKKSGHVKRKCPRLAAWRMKKEKELLQETERLQSLQREGLCCIFRYEKNEKPSSPDRSLVGSDPLNKLAAKKRKVSTSGACSKTVDIQSGDGELDQSALKDSSEQLSKRSRFSENLQGSDQPKCCKQKTSLSGDDENVPGNTICMFQELVECLVGMKVCIDTKADETCISAIHQLSGYSFSLTWIKNSQGDDELLYRVLSLGTIENIALEWMKEMIMFNMKMLPVFFEKMSRVVKLY